jgi:hypothetical protein
MGSRGQQQMAFTRQILPQQTPFCRAAIFCELQNIKKINALRTIRHGMAIAMVASTVCARSTERHDGEVPWVSLMH